MNPLKNTTPEIERLQIEGYRKMTPAQKLGLVGSLNSLLKNLAIEDIRKCHPDANDREILLRYASRTIDAELLKSATGWDPLKEGY